MEETKERFEKTAKEYDDRIIKIIPSYNDMIEALTNSIPFSENKDINILDLGCGTGAITAKIKEKFPNSHVTCLDLAENMIEIAKFKLKKYDNIEFIIGDFSNFDFKDKYDVVVSSLAIHHIETKKGKKELFEKIFSSLKDGGAFYNADVVLGSTDFSTHINNEVWKNNLKKNFNEKEVKELVSNQDKVDIPSKLIDQLKWFEEIGFKDTDVTWKYYGHAVYGGRK
ncbi:8-demethylnovobiocic acid C(8)-methyltransferase [Methanobrevibacter cuticularis]|uniref:8-demethylnovobiocic acid C(8)-methyltransferase n=1 Tax=Methanobrevibacter cuticularis TaxID=47311 RepID=A0A166CVB8_9EURY|nr:class I SAM-dependent methyltransferase [Methanobrevibacter cuticularis]KZX14900.1 8-demethylnovobiocic acid C(8)-methyltransferase [Methanobrevibacter cuticularis]